MKRAILDRQWKNNASQRIYKSDNLIQIAFPLGGIGAGCIAINGYGGLQDFAIRNNPALTVLPKGSKDACFAVISIKNEGATRVIEGAVPIEKYYLQGLQGFGLINTGKYEGLPHFDSSTFRGEYPFAYLNFEDLEIPLNISLRAYNPFIPLDDINSGIPCAILEYRIHNPTKRIINYEFSYHATHLAPGKDQEFFSTSRNKIIPETGVSFYNTEDRSDPEFGSAAFGLIGNHPKIKAMWFRGEWFDAMSVLWRELSEGGFIINDGKYYSNHKGPNGGSILIEDELMPGATKTYPIVITWHFPNVDYEYGVIRDQQNNGCSCKSPGVCNTKWHPFYTKIWQDAYDVLDYVVHHYHELSKRTELFHDALFNTTLPDFILDAISSNLGIIKSPTILRQATGNLWAWEGCGPEKGCCHGSCTHVWNYAQSLPHLFPQLERTIREQEYYRSMDENGHVNFRSALPDGPTTHEFHPAVDGQLGGIMKVYREWQISGNDQWLEDLYPYVKRSLDFCISKWDPKNKGVIEEPHHNTYDIEFWGPDGMCTNFYLGALTAMSELAKAIGRLDETAFYKGLAEKGAIYLKENLFNGEYYEQIITYEGLEDISFIEKKKKILDDSPIEDKLILSEGPKYQYGTGCISDGVFGVLLARLCNIDCIQDTEHVRNHLRSVFKYNFKYSLRSHTNPQRPGFALGDEPGLLLCSWPHGNRPTLPFVYSDEVWTGIEYQVATHLIFEDMLEEGFAIIKSIRSRYDGRKRNPWSEYECGDHYARAMASYGLLLALTGFSYSAVTRVLTLKPKMDTKPFLFFFSIATGWGIISIQKNSLTIKVIEGTFSVDVIHLEVSGYEVEVKPFLEIKAGETEEVNIPCS